MYPIDFFHKAEADHPDRVAIEDDSATLTYGELRRRANALAAGFQALSGRERMKVALLCPNSIDLFVAIVAIHSTAAILVPLNPRNAKAELDAQVELVRPDIVVTDAACMNLLSAHGANVIVAGVDEHAQLPTVRGLIRKHEGQVPSWPEVAATDDYAIKFTGGSSGRPKGVRQSFRSHTAVVVHVLNDLGFADGEVYVCAAPMTHGAGSFIVPTLAVGGKVVIAHGAKPEALLRTLEAASATATWVPPTLLYMLIEEQRARPRRLPRLRHLIFGGAPATPEKIDEARQVFGDVLETTFGQTEASTIATALRARDMKDERVRYSAGRAGTLVRVATVDAAGRRLPSGELGEIVVTGDLLMNGYLGMEDETAKVLVDGWLRTGDVGDPDERGYLFVKDRIRDVVITGGFNVYPSDVEAALARHPAVHECVVFGVSDAHWGERVEAAVELRGGASALPEDIIAFAKDLLGSVKAPKMIHIVDSLPRSPVGKVLRREVKAMLANR